MAEQGESRTVSGRRAKLTRRELWEIVGGMIGMVVYGFFAVLQRHWLFLIVSLVFFGVLAVRLVRPPTVIDRDGIRRPWRRVTVLDWSRVDHVIQPLHANYVQVLTTDNHRINLTDVDVSEIADVAALGGKQVKAEPAYVPKPVIRERTQREIEADVTKRSAALAAEREQMARTESFRTRRTERK